MMNFTILIFEILRNKIKLYEGRQISQITEKVSNQEIFLHHYERSYKYRNRLIDILKNSSREEYIPKLQEYDMSKKIIIFIWTIRITTK